TEGVVSAQSNNALGDVTTTTTVQFGAQLQVQGNGLTIGKNLTLNGAGFDNTGALRMTDGIPGTPETVSLTGNITNLGSIRVDAGGASGDTLILGGAGILSGGTALTKLGAGTLQVAGTNANTYTGGTVINEGTLTLNKTSGLSATGTGNITVG